MKNSKFSEVQIVKILSEQNQGKAVNEICRDHGISQPTFYKWKSKYGGMEAHQLAQLKELEKQLYDELPNINFQWDTYSDITNLILEYNSKFNYENLFKALNDMNVDALEIRFYDHISAVELCFFLDRFKDSNLLSIEILIQYSTYQEIGETVDSFLQINPSISKIFVSNCEERKDNLAFQDSVTIYFLSNNINSCKYCGIVDKKYFNLNMTIFSESVSHNNCLNRKMAIDKGVVVY